ncbi:hypothetical protein C8F04DRAFT_1267967 [Mycena alexandri]|uniref:Uncharacterized protein n=1 Tax=Mycena alexandri TaxID=1745969 RepID=A0AAD6SER4_9AGAR|nr:hypothetical protein C8F04DRAFT_1267967 [Mycena alexandri]
MVGGRRAIPSDADMVLGWRATAGMTGVDGAGACAKHAGRAAALFGRSLGALLAGGSASPRWSTVRRAVSSPLSALQRWVRRPFSMQGGREHFLGRFWRAAARVLEAPHRCGDECRDGLGTAGDVDEKRARCASRFQYRAGGRFFGRFLAFYGGRRCASRRHRASAATDVWMAWDYSGRRRKVRQNEFRISYEPLPIPAESAWMFHIVLVLIRVIGFNGDRDVMPAMDRRNMDTTEGAVAVAQASFFLGAALTTFLKEKSEGLSPDLDYPQYNIHSRVSNNFVVRTTVEGHNPIVQDDTIGDAARINRILSGWREHSVGCGFKEDHECKPFPMTAQPEEYELAARACGIVAAVDSVHCIVLKKGPTRQSLRTLANRLDNVLAPLERTNFFVKQEEEVLSEASHGSMPSLISMSDSEGPSSLSS